MMNKRWTSESPYYAHRKKHDCPLCNDELTVRRVKRIVNSKSPEAKEFDFSSGGEGYMFGDVEFSFEVFYCANCDKEYRINEIRRIEKGLPPQAPEEKRSHRIIRNVLSFIIMILLLIAFTQIRACVSQKNGSEENTQPDGKITIHTVERILSR